MYTSILDDDSECQTPMLRIEDYRYFVTYLISANQREMLKFDCAPDGENCLVYIFHNQERFHNGKRRYSYRFKIHIRC